MIPSTSGKTTPTSTTDARALPHGPGPRPPRLRDRVLLVDDDEDMAVIVRDMLEELGGYWTLETAATAAEAFARIESEAFGVVLVDYRLGAETGFDLIADLEQLDHHPPVVVLTGMRERGVEAGAIRAGASDYLDKSELTPRLLDRTLRYAIERAEAVETLRRREAEYRGLFDKATDGVLVSDDDGRYLDANPGALDLLGVSRAVLLRRTPYDFLDDAPPPHRRAAAWAAFIHNGTMRGRTTIRRPDGERRDVDYSGTANVVTGRHVMILRDVTAQVTAERTARASERRFRRFLRDIELFALIVDRAGQVEFANDFLLRRLGRDHADVVGRPIDAIGIGSGAAHELEALHATFRSGTIQPAWENELANAAG